MHPACTHLKRSDAPDKQQLLGVCMVDEGETHAGSERRVLPVMDREAIRVDCRFRAMMFARSPFEGTERPHV